jgi:hypothetical protein
MFDFLADANTVKVIKIWVAALCTLGIYSILYKENKVFRFFEHLFIGVATGYTIYITWNDTLKPRWWVPMTEKGEWWWAFAVPAGLLFYMIYSKKNVWMSRLIFGLFFGAAAGRSFQGFAALYFPQVRSAINVPLFNTPESRAADAYWLTPFSSAANNLLFLAIVVSITTYFLFSFEQKGKVIPAVSRFGRYVLMFAFGAIFGSTIMARMGLLIGRVYFLVNDWIKGLLLGQG